MTDERNDMERRVDQVLQGLPAPRAPRSLLPRVMAAVAEGDAAHSALGFSSSPHHARAHRAARKIWVQLSTAHS